MVPCKKVTHNVQLCGNVKLERFDASGVPSTLGEARSAVFQFARGDSLHEEGGVADFSEADRNEFIHRHHAMPSEKLYVQTK